MRLLSRQDGSLHFTPFRPPRGPYAILSHRWLAEEEEVSYTDVLTGNVSKPGYQKVDFCLNQAHKDGYEHVWIDSCCIQRSNFSELSESIASMFRWYRDAAVCYVYVADITYEHRDRLTQSEWFKRGWTLQELVAPDNVRFYSSDQRYLGDKETLASVITTATGISTFTLDASIPEKFSWSFGRQVTKPEDESYCMMGLLGVAMMAQYGVTAEDAQERLFERIEKKYGKPTVRAIWSRITLHAANTSENSASSVLREFRDNLGVTIKQAHASVLNRQLRPSQDAYPMREARDVVRPPVTTPDVVCLSLGDVDRIVLFIQNHSEERAVAAIPRKIQNADLHNHQGTTILIEAIKRQYERVVEKVINSSASVDAQDKHHRTALIWASRIGSKKMADLLIRGGASLEIAAGEGIHKGMTPLSWAAHHGHMEVVALLLDKGAQLEATDNYGRTPLLHAAARGYEKLVELLLSAGANVGALSKTGSSALHQAVKQGHTSTVALLLLHKANLHQPEGKHKLTPLHIASIEGHTSIVNILLDHGANIDPQSNEYKTTPLLYACYYRRSSVAKTLLKRGADPSIRRADGVLSIAIAIQEGKLDIVEAHLARGVSIFRDLDGRGNNAAFVAALAGQVELLDFFLRKGIRTDDRTSTGLSLLHAASRSASIKAVELLVEKRKMSVSTKDAKHHTPLHVASFYGHTQTIECLIKYGADISALTLDNLQPLMLAAGKGRIEAATLLMSKGADINASTADGGSALDHAIGNELLEMVEFLLERGARIEMTQHHLKKPTILYAAQLTSDVYLRKLIEYGAQVNYRQSAGPTALMIAAEHGCYDNVLLLLEHGADVHAQAHKLELTALGVAVLCRNLAVGELLAHRGANVNAHYQNGRTALHLAAKTCQLDFCKVLVELGAELYAEDHDGYLPLDYAKAHQHQSVVDYLQEHMEVLTALT